MIQRIITFGEIMLRLKSPANERLFQSPWLEATFGGGEANVAVSLAQLGRPVEFITALPDTPVGDAAVNELRRYGVNVSGIIRSPGRVGIYYLEAGANQRPSLVVYDREESCISKAEASFFDWNAIFSGVTWFHLTGITPALSQIAADTSLAAVRTAKKSGAIVSIDLNYRKKLWNYGRPAPAVMRQMVQYADVIIANEEDIQNCLGIHLSTDALSNFDISAYQQLTATVKKEFPNIAVVAVTLRESKSADKNNWSAVVNGRNGFYTSMTYEIDDIVDRVGGGDAFAAGLIFGLTEWPEDEQRALDFAIAASCLKHSIPGDFNLSRRSEVEALCNGNSTGRIQR